MLYQQERQASGLFAKLQAHNLQDTDLDTFKANKGRTHPEKAQPFKNDGINIAEILPTGVHPMAPNLPYLRAKACKGHPFTIALGPQNAREAS